MTDGAIKYVPILRGRMGEMRALKELGDDHQDTLIPLLEIPLKPVEPTGDDQDAEDAVAVEADPVKFAEDIKKNVSGDRRVIIDATQAPAGGPDSTTATVQVFRTLVEAGFDATPTVRPSDAESDISALREALTRAGSSSVCVRLAGDDLDDNDRPLASTVEQLLAGLDVRPTDADLLVDFGAVGDDQSVAFAARIARLVLSEMPFSREWRTLTVAGGGFPADLNSVPPEVLTEIPRHDAAMWRAIRDRVRGRIPGFADYGIGFPTQATGAAFAPAPQLRFTNGDSWLIYKGRKRDRRGSRQFYDICGRMVSVGVVDPDLSWGDSYVASATNGSESGLGPGNATTWRAIGTSHHLSYVANRLASPSGP